jgi:hypothetical protein
VYQVAEYIAAATAASTFVTATSTPASMVLTDCRKRNQ